MMMGFTAAYECPECVSKQQAVVLSMAAGGQRVGRLRCVICDTEFNPADATKEVLWPGGAVIVEGKDDPKDDDAE